MKKYYIFDFDGTLVDSMPCWSNKMLNILNKSKVNYPNDIITTIATLGDNASIDYFINVLGVGFDRQLMLNMMDQYALPKYRDEILLKEHVKSKLIQLYKQGHSLNVLTASPHKMLDPCLRRNGIYDLFDNVWSTDDFCLTKSNPEIYLKALELLSCNICDAIFVDDNPIAIDTANRAGLFTVGVYDETGKDFESLLKSNSNKFIYSFKDL